ncbi:MAG: 2-C-methyl-D-erythritol 4-phosphate cytidylyltransferase [Burkholderiaceae bacterium]|nr:2-C-methyl-D-erythritol 4-phosphate cytidylyltransferase [Burkholderiaceae bacterium]
MTLVRPRLIAIVPAAGTGSRAGGGDGALPKQYRLLNGQPMLRWSVLALLADPRIDQVRVAVAPDDTQAASALQGLPRTVWRACGGDSRAATVLAALQDCRLDADDRVLVHDAARPGLPADALARLIDYGLTAQDGALLALPVADTVKQAYGMSSATAATARVRVSVPRDDLWLAQTPQMFPALGLLQALQAAGGDYTSITDEASAMEMAGCQPGLVSGSVRNFKVTWPEDFGLMAKWLEEK